MLQTPRGSGRAVQKLSDDTSEKAGDAIMTGGSLFSGLGAFDLAFQRAGYRILWQVEKDKSCQRVLEQHWPDVPKHDDVRTFHGTDAAIPDVIFGGSPCQDWSVAGKRAGLAGARTGLFFEFVRVVDEIAPQWLLFENVPGLLSACSCRRCHGLRSQFKPVPRSHRGRDFATVLGEITGFVPEVPTKGWRNSGICCGPKRAACWRVFNSQYDGVAQRRRRVFLIASSGDWGDPSRVLFEPNSLPGDPAPGTREWKEAARPIERGIGEDSFGITVVQAAKPIICRERIRDSGPVIYHQENLAYSLDAPVAGGGRPQMTITSLAVRRIMPIEALRLMALPDDWLDLDPPLSDSKKYRMIGNAGVANTVQWIAERIRMVHESRKS